MSKKAIIPSATLAALIIVGIIGSSAVQAQEFGRRSGSAAQKLAETFGLQEDEVEAVFEAVRDEHQEQMRGEKGLRLDEAVTSGVITEEQKQAIVAKQNEMRQQAQNRMQEHREEMDSWFEENGIDHDALQEYMGGPGPKGPGQQKGWN